MGIGLGNGQACRTGNKGLSYAPSEQYWVYPLEVSPLMAYLGLLDCSHNGKEKGRCGADLGAFLYYAGLVC